MDAGALQFSGSSVVQRTVGATAQLDSSRLLYDRDVESFTSPVARGTPLSAARKAASRPGRLAPLKWARDHFSWLVHLIFRPLLRPLPCIDVLCMIIWTVLVHALAVVHGYPRPFSLVLGVASLLCAHHLPQLLFARCPRLVASADWFIIYASAMLAVYRIQTGFFLDYNVLHLNVGLLKYGESFSAAPVGTERWAIFAFALPMVLWLALRAKLDALLPPVPMRWCGGFLQAAVVIATLCVAVLGKTSTVDMFTELLRSMLEDDPRNVAVMDTEHLLSVGIDPALTFPLIRDDGPVPAESAMKSPLPHIIVLALESFSATYMFKNCTWCDPSLGSSLEFTPNVNAFARNNLYSNAFYGNSIQTARSHFAIQCGVPPSWRGKVFTDHYKLNARCLPRILSEVGYHSLFWSSQESLQFDNEGFAMKNIVGFDDTLSMNARKASSPSKNWGMGWQDDDSYEAFFKHLDEHAQNDTRPWFSFVTSISHHMQFDRLPASEQRLYRHTSNPSRRQNYEDSIHAADRYFETFVRLLEERRWLDNAIIVVMGDHSFPNGEHSNFYNTFAAYEENFRVPLIIRAPNLPSDAALIPGGSQLDFPSTILDMLQVRTKHHFYGSSLLAPPTQPRRPTVMAQPYAGVYFVSVRWPLKLRYDFRTKRYVLIDLEADPDEQHNLIDNPALHEQQALMTRDLTIPLLTQQLIEANRVYPPATNGR